MDGLSKSWPLMTSTKAGWGRNEEKLALPSWPLPFWMTGECMPVPGMAIKHIPRKQNTWIQSCLCFMWFNPCSPCSFLATKQCVCLKKGWASPALLLKPCNGAGTKNNLHGPKASNWGPCWELAKHCVSHAARLFHRSDVLSCSLLCLPQSASACVCLKKGLYFWGLSEAV